MLYINFGVDRTKIDKSLFISVFHFMEISKINLSWQTFHGPRGFFVKHFKPDLCDKFYVNRTHGACPIKVFPFLDFNYNATIRQNDILWEA